MYAEGPLTQPAADGGGGSVYADVALTQAPTDTSGVNANDVYAEAPLTQPGEGVASFYAATPLTRAPGSTGRGAEHAAPVGYDVPVDYEAPVHYATPDGSAEARVSVLVLCVVYCTALAR